MSGWKGTFKYLDGLAIKTKGEQEEQPQVRGWSRQEPRVTPLLVAPGGQCPRFLSFSGPFPISGKV